MWCGGDGVLDLIVLEVLKALLVDLRFLEAKLLAEAKHLLAIEVDDVTEVPTRRLVISRMLWA